MKEEWIAWVQPTGKAWFAAATAPTYSEAWDKVLALKLAYNCTIKVVKAEDQLRYAEETYQE